MQTLYQLFEFHSRINHLLGYSQEKMTSLQFKLFYQTLKVTIPSKPMSFEEMRRTFEEIMRSYRASSDIKFARVQFKHCDGAWITPPKITSKKIVLFFHGGGYTAGSWQSHQDMLGRIAKEGEVAVCAVNYRLAPEHPFPAALNDAVKAYESLLAQGHLPQQIIVAGSSAGGGLAIALLLKLKSLKKELPRAGVLICPWVDLALKGETLKANDGQDLISRVRVENASKAYLGDHDSQDPLVSPLYGDLSHLPPLLIQAGTIELLWSEIEAFVQKAQKAGVNVTFEPYPGMFHTWQLYASKIPEGEQAIHSIGRFLQQL